MNLSSPQSSHSWLISQFEFPFYSVGLATFGGYFLHRRSFSSHCSDNPHKHYSSAQESRTWDRQCFVIRPCVYYWTNHTINLRVFLVTLAFWNETTQLLIFTLKNGQLKFKLLAIAFIGLPSVIKVHSLCCTMFIYVVHVVLFFIGKCNISSILIHFPLPSCVCVCVCFILKSRAEEQPFGRGKNWPHPRH